MRGRIGKKRWLLLLALAVAGMILPGWDGAPEYSSGQGASTPVSMLGLAGSGIRAALSPAAAHGAVAAVAPKKKKKGARAVSKKKKGGSNAAEGRCEPQSLTYARERSGIMRSRNGWNNGPLTWFAAEEKLGMTSEEPFPGSILILGANHEHNMPTGHVAYVEEVYPAGAASYKIIFSHTNYDRKCSLETNIEAVYDSSDMTLDIYSGAWWAWGRGLKVAGFIYQ